MFDSLNIGLDGNRIYNHFLAVNEACINVNIPSL